MSQKETISPTGTGVKFGDYLNEEVEELPVANDLLVGKCSCTCHSVPGVYHVTACCYPLNQSFTS